MRPPAHTRRVARNLIAVLAIAWLLPLQAFAVAPTTSVSEIPGPNAAGWWNTAPFITLTSNQDGTLYWRWDSGPETAVAVLDGVGHPLVDPAPEGDHVLSAYAVNSLGETETPAGVYKHYRVDTQEPTQPGSFAATLIPSLGVNLTWSASTDAGASGLLRYEIFRKTGLPPFQFPDDYVGYVTAGSTTYLDVPPGSVEDYIYAVRAIDLAGNESYLSEIDPTPTLIPVYRFYNFRTGTHFYTASDAERDQIVRDLAWTFSLEGTAYHAYGTPTGCVQLHRFYNKRTGTHFYTASEAEMVSIVSNLGWLFAYDGPAYYVSLNPAGTLPVHRFYNRRTGTHFYTASEAERQSVQDTLSAIYAYEGVAFHVLP